MAQPVIRGVHASATEVQPGDSVTVDVDAFDPDARSVTAVATVTDSSGNAATATTTVTVGDPLTYALVVEDPDVQVVQDPTNPAHFTLRF